MALPNKRSTKSHKRTRAAHFALKKVDLVSCPKCKKAKLQHRVCMSCGFYNGRDVLRKSVKLEKTLAKAKKAQS